MLNFFALIKKRTLILSGIGPVFLTWMPSTLASAGELTRTAEQKPAESDSSHDYFAAARMISPDGKTELGTSEVRVKFNGNTSTLLKGRGFNVTLESEPNLFRHAQMLKISASGASSGSFNAGMFRLTPHQPHSFLYTEKSKGWVLEVRLRPAQNKSGSPLQQGKPKAPVRLSPRKPKRLPA